MYVTQSTIRKRAKRRPDITVETTGFEPGPTQKLPSDLYLTIIKYKWVSVSKQKGEVKTIPKAHENESASQFPKK